MPSHPPSYRGYRFTRAIISHAVWLYHRFGLSFRDVEDPRPFSMWWWGSSRDAVGVVLMSASPVVVAINAQLLKQVEL